MNLLFIGDVVGESGCDFLEKHIYALKKEFDIDFTVINGENSAKGNGITPKSYDRLMQMGADVITTGNHCFQRKEGMDLFDIKDNLLRPYNYPYGVVGHGVTVVDLGMTKIAVVNLMGTVGLDALDNPFFAMDRLLSDIDTPNIFVDFHAEATSEKKVMAHYLDGRVSAVLGTHTHTPTADEQLLPGKTAFITDVGMTGVINSVLGVEIGCASRKVITGLPVHFKNPEGECRADCVIIETDNKTGRAVSIERFSIQ